MNKIKFVSEIGDLANKLAFLLQSYTGNHDGYDAETANKEPIIMANISVSIQNGVLATISADVGSVDSKHRIRIDRYPNANNTEWRIEDK